MKLFSIWVQMKKQLLANETTIIGPKFVSMSRTNPPTCLYSCRRCIQNLAGKIYTKKEKKRVAYLMNGNRVSRVKRIHTCFRRLTIASVALCCCSKLDRPVLKSIMKRSLKFQANVPAILDHLPTIASGMLNLTTKKSACIVESEKALNGSEIVSQSWADSIDFRLYNECST